MQMRLRLAADASLNSVFAEYDDALWGTFHLLFRAGGDRTGENLQGRVLSYAAENLGDEAYAWGQQTDWFFLHPESAEVSDIVFATDQNGAVFEQAVKDYMRSGMVTIMIDELISRLGVFSGGDAQQQLEGIDGKGDFSFDAIYGDYKDLKEKAEEAKRKQEEEQGQEQGDEPEDTPAVGGDETPGYASGEEQGLTLEDVLETVKNLMLHGFMGIVVDNPNGISHQNVTGSDYPSHLSGGEKSRHANLSPVTANGSSSSLVDKLLVDEYLLRFLDCYTTLHDLDVEEDNSTPEYQVEYVIAGKNSDYDNLKTVVNRLLWFREGLNMIYLLSDSAKREEVQLLALVLIAPTGQLYLTDLAAGVLMAAWAFAESLRDVKGLLAGGKVPLLKDASTWKTSLENITTDIAEGANDGEVDDLPTDPGLTYVDYLRILMAFVNPELRNYRGMDMIQAAMRRTREGFNMTQCVYACSASITASGSYRFLIFAPLLPSGKEGGYQLSCRTWYGYKKRS